MAELEPSQEKGAKIKQVFTSLNRKFEEQDTQRRARLVHLPYFDLTGVPIEQGALALVPREQATLSQAVPFFKEGPLLKLGTSDPLSPELKKLLASLEKAKYQVEVYLVSPSSLELALWQYKKILPISQVQRHEVDVQSGERVLEKLHGLASLGEKLEELSATDLLNLIIGGAVTVHASDIHLEPEKDQLKIRFRVDGVLQEATVLPLRTLHNLLSRIKLLAGLKLNVTHTPQDGRFSVKADDKNLDLRVSALPAEYGESIVMRILGVQDIELDIEKLGLRGLALERISEELKKPNGMILTTGPTGSGKTTTLYAFLNRLNRPGAKIITIEDPVEYRLEGLIQTPIDHAAGLDFAKGLRSILRQDPDIVMVGEIRDYETAETASQAALTGHLVLSTLHTNDAAGAIPRLLDFGVKPVTLAPALNALIAQRLVRKICEHCKGPYRATASELERVKRILSQIPQKADVQVPEQMFFYRSKGCPKCHKLGYQGRLGVFEVFVVDEKIEDLIFSQASTHEIRKAAIAQGMLTMQQDGILKALEGVTDLSEVWRVTEE